MSKYLILLWLLLSGFCQFAQKTHKVDKSFKKLSHEEKSEIKYFFEAAIKTDQLGHVLFFSTKPACFFILNPEEEDAFTKAWSIWRSKEHLFPHPNFIIYEERCDEKLYVYFINKQTLLSQLSSKEEALRDTLSINEFVTKLESKEFDGLICKNQILLELLLNDRQGSSSQELEKIEALSQSKNLPLLCLRKLCSN